MDTVHVRSLVHSVGRVAASGALVLLIAGKLAVSSAVGQSPTTPRFEVTSVKPVREIPRWVEEPRCSNGRFVSKRMTARYLILWAWNLLSRPDSLIGLPSWGLPDYEIEARAASPISEDVCRSMVRSLLADRFQLATHEETRLVDGYVLVVAKNGPKIKQVTSPDAPPNGPGFTIDGRADQVFEVDLKGWSMAQLAQALSMGHIELRRPVFDRTGLDGIYRIDLKFRTKVEGEDPDIRTALRAQLGLELVASKETFKVLVVDHIERPGPN